MSGNTFDSNTATTFNGQVGYNALTYPTGQPGTGQVSPHLAPWKLISR